MPDGFLTLPRSGRCALRRERGGVVRLMVWLLGVLGLLCVALLAAWWAAPEQLRRQVELRGTEALGRPVRLQQFQLSLVPLRVTLQGLEVGEVTGGRGAAASAHGLSTATVAGSASAPTAGPTPAPTSASAPAASTPGLLQVERLEVEVDPWSLWRREPEVTRLLVEGWSVHLSRSASGAWSVDDLLRRFRQTETPAPQAGPPLLFTLRDLDLRGGRLSLEDGQHGQRHEIAQLQLSLPWWSNRPADAQREVQARLSSRVNGAPLSLQASAWPLRTQAAVQARLDVSGLDLAPLWAWWPSDLPLRPQQGSLEARIDLRGEQAPGGAWRWGVSGPVALNALSVVNVQGAPMASWQRLELGLQEVRPLDKAIHLAEVRLTGGQVHVRRDRQGQLEWAALSSASPATPQASAPAAPCWDIRSGPVAVEGLQVHWSDQVPQPAVRARVSALDLRMDQLSWPVRAPSAFKVKARIEPPGGRGVVPRQALSLALQGTASDEAARVSWRVGRLALTPWQPYLASVLQPVLQGTARAEGELQWAAGARPVLAASVRSLQMDDFQARFPGASSPPVAWKSLAVEGLRADLLARRVEVGQVTWREPVVQAQRTQEGALTLVGVPSLEALLVPAGERAGLQPAAPPLAGRSGRGEGGGVRPTELRPTAQEPDWRVALGRLQVAAARLELADQLVPSDREPGAPWTLNLNPVSLEAERLAWPPGPSPFTVRLEVQWPQTGPAGLPHPSGVAPEGAAQQLTPPAVARIEGRMRLDAPTFQGTVQLERWPVQRFEPQWTHLGVALPVRLARADLALDSRLELRLGPQGLETSGEGAVRVADVQVLARPASLHAAGANPSAPSPQASSAGSTVEPSADELARWNLLQLEGLRWAVVPGQKPRVQVGLVRLSDFFARLQVTEAGRLNLQDVAAPRPGAAAARAESGAPQTPPLGAREPQPPGAVTDKAAVPAGAPRPDAKAALDWSVDRTELVNGRVDFIDRFIRPNYAADLTELNGSLGRFESGSTAMAPLELRGRAARTALLEIRGAVNPTASPLMLDLSARATDLELAPLSPYGGKYVGYVIERGKLSVDLSYRIEADGRLEARNQIILNQLTFGQAVDSPQATRLPVRLALALLADRNGVIDVNLPISGSINEPQFSLMGLVFKMIGNLLVKVVTAPFAWLSGSGTQDLSAIGFDPGAARLEAPAVQTLDQLFRALSDRPALRMTITGAADLASESGALRSAGLQERLMALLRREAARAGPSGIAGLFGSSGTSGTSGTPASSGSAVPAPLVVPPRGTPAHDALLRRLYVETPLPDKPRNLLGLRTTPAAPQMEAMLLAAIPVNENSARELALQRALTVRDALIARGLPAERLFLAAPQVTLDAGASSRPEVRMAITGP
jgi:Domain of Unknown Function (DUF748)